MCSLFRMRLLAAFCAIVVLLGMVWGCAPSPAPAPAPEAPQPAEATTVPASAEAPAAPPFQISTAACVTPLAGAEIQIIPARSTASVEYNACFAPDQFIMYGTPDGIECVLKQEGVKRFDPILLKEIVLQGPEARAGGKALRSRSLT